MNILVVPATDWLAGPENRFHRIFHRLAKKHNIHCLYLDSGGKKLRSESLLTLHKPRLLKTENLTLFHSLNVLQQYNAVWRIIRNEQIQIVVTSNIFGGTAGIYAAQKARIASVFDYVDYIPFFADHLSAPGFVKSPIRAILTELTEYNLRNSNLVFAIGTLLINHASRFNDNVVLLPNGVNTTRFSPTISGNRIRSLFGLNGFVIGYVGYVQFWTDFKPVLEGFKKILKKYQNSKFFLIGIGPRFSEFQSLVDKMEIRSNVITPGYVPYNQLPEYLSAMDAYILPFIPSFGTQAGLPLKIHEYSAMGKPTVSTPLNEIITYYRDAVLLAETAEEYESAIRTLIEKPELRLKMGKNAREIVSKNFNWDIIANQYEKHLLKLIND